MDRAALSLGRGPRGAALVELVMALALGLAVAGLALRLAAAALDLQRQQGERAGAAAVLRAAAGYLERELEGLGADSVAGPDFDSVAGGLAVRAPRGLRVACRVAPDTVVAAADTALDWSVRQPVPVRDSLLLYAPGDATGAIDAWDPLPLLGVGPAPCPGGGPGVALLTRLDSALLARRRHGGPTVVRVFEPVVIRAYPGVGGWQLGQLSPAGGGTIQPVAGPLAPAGFRVEARDAGGVPVPVGPGARVLRVVLHAVADRSVAAGLGPRSVALPDSLAVAAYVGTRP